VTAGPTEDPAGGAAAGSTVGPTGGGVVGPTEGAATDVTAVPASSYPGTPDGFGRLWTPHRMAYIDSQAGRSTTACPFCAAPGLPDSENLVVRRGELAYVVLNLFPYNSGHLLVCPYRHVADYRDLTAPETVELAVLTQESMSVVDAVHQPQGFNLGMNQGSVAGAGIAAHLHQHVVPRWAGDSNFFPIVAQTKALPQLLADTRDRLRTAWAAAAEGRGHAAPERGPGAVGAGVAPPGGE